MGDVSLYLCGDLKYERGLNKFLPPVNKYKLQKCFLPILCVPLP